MTSKLFTSSFIKVCMANFFLFSTLYLFLAITPFEYDLRLQNEGYAGWYLYLSFIVGLLVGGPFHNFFIEKFNRKKVTFFSYVAVTLPIISALYTHPSALFIFVALFIQGIAFGLATAASITIAIDVTTPYKRGKGNIIYAWSGRLGMVLGIPLSIYLYASYSYNQVVFTALSMGLLAVLFILSTRHPFRAPLHTETLSFDRFILPRGWKMILIMVLIAFVPGSLFPHFIQNIAIKSFDTLSNQFVFIVLPFLVFLLSALLSRIEIDALLHNRGFGYLFIRLPLPLIAGYLLYHYSSSMSIASLFISSWLLVGFVFSIATALTPHRIYPKINKWVLESQYRVEVTSPIFSGLLCILLALLLERDLNLTDYTSYLVLTQLLLFGLARVSSPIFLLLILSSKHCERGTANTSQHLAWEIGLALGAITTLLYKLSLVDVILLNSKLVGLAVIIYLIIRYKLHKLAHHKHS